MTAWRTRITGAGTADPAELRANPRNWRVHPDAQQQALAGALDAVGWVTGVIVNTRTGLIVDGHLRVALAAARGEPSIPVQFVDLDEREEAIVLASIDPISTLAGRDASLLADLVADLDLGDNPLAAMLEDYAGFADEAEFPTLPTGDRPDIRQMTFTVTAAQEGVIKQALAKAKSAGFVETGNANSNGNALAAVCAAFVE